MTSTFHANVDVHLHGSDVDMGIVYDRDVDVNLPCWKVDVNVSPSDDGASTSTCKGRCLKSPSAVMKVSANFMNHFFSIWLVGALYNIGPSTILAKCCACAC